VYTLKSPLASKAHSYGKGLVRIINHGHDCIFRELKPELMSDNLWEIVRMSWAVDPSQRPSMADVNGMLAGMREDARG
jgi:hypothetical protein